MRDDLTHAIHEAQGGDRAAGFVLLRHVTRSGDPTLLLLGLAAATHPPHRRRAIALTCAWWGRPFEALREQTFRRRSPRWSRHRNNPSAFLRAEYAADWQTQLQRALQSLWPPDMIQGLNHTHWLGWNASTCRTAPQTLSEAVSLAAPAIRCWPADLMSLPALWRARLARSWPPLRLVRALHLRSKPAERVLLAHPDLTEIERLSWRYMGETPDLLEALVRAPFPRLESLSVDIRRASAPPDLRPLLGAPWFRGLKSLRLRCTSGALPDGDAFLSALCQKPPLGLETLALQNWNITAVGAASLAAAGFGGQITHLCLRHNPLRDEGALALAASGLRPVHVCLRGCDIGPVGARAIAPLLADTCHLSVGFNPLASEGVFALLKHLNPERVRQLSLRSTGPLSEPPRRLTTQTPQGPLWAVAGWGAPKLQALFADWREPALLLQLLRAEELPSLHLHLDLSSLGDPQQCALLLQALHQAPPCRSQSLSVQGPEDAAIQALLERGALPEALCQIVIHKTLTCPWGLFQEIIEQYPRIKVSEVKTGFAIYPPPPQAEASARARSLSLRADRGVWVLQPVRYSAPQPPAWFGTLRDVKLAVDSLLTPPSVIVGLIAQHTSTPLSQLSLHWALQEPEALRALLAGLRALPIAAISLTPRDRSRPFAPHILDAARAAGWFSSASGPLGQPLIVTATPTPLFKK